MYQAPGADAVFDRFGSCSDEDWLNVLVSSLRVPEINGARMPDFPDESLQQEIHGHSGEVSLHEAHTFYREIKAYAAFAGRPLAAHQRLMDFGCGWGRMARLFMKDIHALNLFGVDSTERFLMEARRCNPALNFLTCSLVPPLIVAPETFDTIISWSVFSHLDEFLANHWMREFHRVLKPGGLVMFTTQSRRFISFCAEMRTRRASGMRLEHGWYEACADSFVDEAAANSRYEAGQFLHAASVQPPHPQSHYGEAIIPRGYVVSKWGHLFRMIEFLDNPVRLPQVMIVLQKIDTV
ncbi:hypothetical protein AA103196_1285 [Ameyamaea chiangmaiensis NBRC 103196]|uniref:Class I SAM-dependent methyltransferase n=1 Tax=Ameyamaea chiangmaiensis TaxID=442969 RepID=A0A850P9Y1_9PROT|nr:class I SAM-dependent methyltransferase [Ameyamaea chiangmaiensis]MBS4075106.1 class I SAM-dependent methyltransferase [Ameyamaea chiangmaiensis]NVN41395.1 class I SAM-dependent methyltransferase [Ameyamaea chiangmaiensis]GBQ66072.1 hypothetical protein AA103196_1285 [Ameyamaea chiangmaiensis NBRC 103196]